MNLKCCRIIKTFKLSFFVCVKWISLFFGQCQSCVTWEHGTNPCWAKAHPRISKSFPNFLYVCTCADGKRKFDEWVGLELGAGLWLLGLTVEGKGPAAAGLCPEHSGAGAHRGKAVCPSFHHTPLWLLGCCNVGSQPKPANELQILIPFAFEKDTGAKLHVYGQQKDNDLEQLPSEISELQFSD